MVEGEVDSPILVEDSTVDDTSVVCDPEGSVEDTVSKEIEVVPASEEDMVFVSSFEDSIISVESRVVLVSPV